MDAVKTGALIAQARKEKELTQGDLAQQLHVSVQAVSKWERGLNFPDITLLEPLAEQLELTVSELMAGERNAPPREETVRDSLRVGLTQLGPKGRRWRVAFVCLALLLALLGGWRGYIWVRDNTEWLPQHETVVTPVDVSRVDALVARVADQHIISLFDVAFADDLEGWKLQLELWESDGLKQTWPIFSGGANTPEDDYPRHHPLGLAVKLMDDQVSYRLLFGGVSTGTTLTDFPHPQWNGYGWDILNAKTTVSRDTGTVLASFGLDLGNGVMVSDGLGNSGQLFLEPGCAVLLVRLVCE